MKTMNIHRQGSFRLVVLRPNTREWKERGKKQERSKTKRKEVDQKEVVVVVVNKMCLR